MLQRLKVLINRGFAAKLISEETTIDKCKPLLAEKYSELKKKMVELLDEAGYLILEK